MAPEHQPTHFMRGTVAEIWGTDTHKIMHTAADWEKEKQMDYISLILLFLSSYSTTQTINYIKTMKAAAAAAAAAKS